MACGGGCGCEACGEGRRGRGVVLAPFGTEASCGCDGGASATVRTGARRPPRHPALAGVTAEEPVGVGAPARGGVRAGVAPPQALEQRPDPETLRFPVLPGTPESSPTLTSPEPRTPLAPTTPPPVAPSQGVDVPVAPGVRQPLDLPAPRMHFEEPAPRTRGKGGSGEPQARQPDDGELRVGDPAQLERPAPWDVVVMPPLGPWGSGPLLEGSAPRRRGPGAKIALGVAQRAPKPPEIHATLLPWGTLSTTPSMPTTASGDAKAAEPCPCTCACVPAEVAPATSTTKVNAPGALLPGGGAAGTGGAAPGAILVSHDDEPEAAARLASIGIAGAPQRLSPPPEGDVDSTTSPGAGTTPPDPAASAQDAAESAREAEALAHEAARETAAADTVEGKVRGSARAEAAAGAAKQAAKDARDRAAGAPSDRKASADRAARDAGKAAARAEKAADAAKKDKLRAIVASGGGGKGKGLSQDGTEEVLPVRTPPVSSPSDVARRPSPPPLSPPLHPSGGVGGSTRVAVPDGALPAVRGFGPGSGRTVALGVASPPREAAPFGAGGRIDGTAAPWVAPAPSAFGPGGALRRRERAAVAAAPPNSAPTVPLPDRVGWMLGEVGGGERDAGREFDRTPFGAEGSTQRPVGGLVSRTKDATTPSALAVAPPQVPDAPAGPVRTPAGAASPWTPLRGAGAGAGSRAGAGVAAVVPPQGAPRSAGPLRGRSFSPAAVAPGTAALGPADGGVPVAAAGDVAPDVPSRPTRTPPGSGAQPGVALRSAALDVPDGTERGAGGRGAVEDAVDARLSAGALASEAARARAAADAAREEADAARVTSDADLATYLRLVAKSREGPLSDAEVADLKRAADSMKAREDTLDPLEKAAAEGEARADALDAASASARAAADDLATRAGAGNSQTADRIADGVRRRIDGAGGEAEVKLLELRDDRRISSRAGNLRGEIGAFEKARGREAAAHLARGAALDREDARQAELRTKAATSSLGPTERRDLARLERREDRRDAERERMLDREIGLAGKLLGKLRTLRGKLEDAGKDTSEVDAKIKETEDSLGRLGRARDDLRDRRSRRAKAKAKGRTPEPSAMPMAWVTEQASVASSVSATIGDTFSASAYAQVLAPEGSLFSSSAVLSAHGDHFDVGRGVLDASLGFASATVSAADVVAPPQLVSLVGGPCPPGCCDPACKAGEVCRCIATTDPVTPDGTDPSSKTGEPLQGPPTPTPPTPGGGRGGGATGGAGGGGLTTQPPPGTVAPAHTYAPPVKPPPPPDDTTTLAPPGSCPPGSYLCDGSGTVAPPIPPGPDARERACHVLREGSYAHTIRKVGSQWYVYVESSDSGVPEGVYAFDEAANRALSDGSRKIDENRHQISGLRVCEAGNIVHAVRDAQKRLTTFVSRLGLSDVVAPVLWFFKDDNLFETLILVADGKADKVTGEMWFLAAFSVALLAAQVKGGGKAGIGAKSGLAASRAAMREAAEPIRKLTGAFLRAADGRRSLERLAKLVGRDVGRLSAREADELAERLARGLAQAVAESKVSTFKELERLVDAFPRKGLTRHHLVEQRAIRQLARAGKLGDDAAQQLIDDAPSILVPRGVHQEEFSNLLQRSLPHGDLHSLGEYYVSYREAYRQLGPGHLEAVDRFFKTLLDASGTSRAEFVEQVSSAAKAIRTEVDAGRVLDAVPWTRASGATVPELLGS